MSTREERARRYRAGLCVTCGEKPYSAGRPRCFYMSSNLVAQNGVQQ